MEPVIETPTRSVSFFGRVLIAMGDIKLAHSVFALPFAVLGAFLVIPRHGGGRSAPRTVIWETFSLMLVLIVICMVFARSWAMLVNRIADAKIDADNPRTARRAFASGRLSIRDGYLMLALNALGFIGSCALFIVIAQNWYPLILSVPVLVWIGFYSFTKRFTWLCHVFLGGALAASPIAAAIAVNPDALFGLDSPGVFWIAGMVACWAGGFDIIYALQDLDYDQEVGRSLSSPGCCSTSTASSPSGARPGSQWRSSRSTGSCRWCWGSWAVLTCWSSDRQGTSSFSIFRFS